jgi:amylosucrase
MAQTAVRRVAIPEEELFALRRRRGERDLVGPLGRLWGGSHDIPAPMGRLHDPLARHAADRPGRPAEA